MHFKPSYHSQVGYPRYNYDLAGYGAAEWPGGGKPYVDVKDIPGDIFRVKSSGVIEWLSGNGKLFHSGNAVYDQMLKHLMDVGGNRKKIESVLGPSVLAASLASPPLITASGAPPATAAEVVAATPFYQQPWFLPTVIGVGTLGVIGVIVWSTR